MFSTKMGRVVSGAVVGMLCLATGTSALTRSSVYVCLYLDSACTIDYVCTQLPVTFDCIVLPPLTAEHLFIPNITTVYQRSAMIGPGNYQFTLHSDPQCNHELFPAFIISDRQCSVVSGLYVHLLSESTNGGGDSLISQSNGVLAQTWEADDVLASSAESIAATDFVLSVDFGGVFSDLSLAHSTALQGESMATFATAAATAAATTTAGTTDAATTNAGETAAATAADMQATTEAAVADMPTAIARRRRSVRDMAS